MAKRLLAWDRARPLFCALAAAGLIAAAAPAAFAVADGFNARDTHCSPQQAPLTADDSEQLAELSVELMNDPSGGDCLLGTYGMTRDGYVDVMAEVSQSRHLSAAYNDAFERAQN